MTALYEKNWESAYHHQADTIASLDDQIETLKKRVKEYDDAIRKFLEGDYPHPRTYRPDQCPHDKQYWEDCGECDSEYWVAQKNRIKEMGVE